MAASADPFLSLEGVFLSTRLGKCLHWGRQVTRLRRRRVQRVVRATLSSTPTSSP
jgi:hypothetical protein